MTQANRTVSSAKVGTTRVPRCPYFQKVRVGYYERRELHYAKHRLAYACRTATPPLYLTAVRWGTPSVDGVQKSSPIQNPNRGLATLRTSTSSGAGCVSGAEGIRTPDLRRAMAVWLRV